ncbi:hypothetical protein VaNZ11_014255, partial [Volvox africanus]
ETKKQLSSLAAAEQQYKLQLADSTAQLDDMRVQLQRMQAEAEEQIAAVRRDAAASGLELEALREQLRLAQQQGAQQQGAQQEQYAAAAAAAATTTAATAGTIIAPGTTSAGDVDMELARAPSPIVTCGAAANWDTIASSAGEDGLWKEVNELRAQLIKVKADGRDTAGRLRAVE